MPGCFKLEGSTKIDTSPEVNGLTGTADLNLSVRSDQRLLQCLSFPSSPVHIGEHGEGSLGGKECEYDVLQCMFSFCDTKK